MTREEQINQELLNDPNFDCSCNFMKGVEWADAHPITEEITPTNSTELFEALGRLHKLMSPNITSLKIEYSDTYIYVYLRRYGAGCGRWFYFRGLSDPKNWEKRWEGVMRYINKANGVKR